MAINLFPALMFPLNWPVYLTFPFGCLISISNLTFPKLSSQTCNSHVLLSSVNRDTILLNVHITRLGVIFIHFIFNHFIFIHYSSLSVSHVSPTFSIQPASEPSFLIPCYHSGSIHRHSLVQTIILSWLDYCYDLLTGYLTYILIPLQSILHTSGDWYFKK